MLMPRLFPLARLWVFLALATLPALIAVSAMAQENVEMQNPAVFQELRKPWTGDLDGMVDRRFIRVLVTYSKTNYFLDGAAQRGVTAEAFSAFEKWLNKKLGMKVHSVNVMFIPVKRDQLFTALESGLGDVAAASLTITPARLRVADFTNPWQENVEEVVVTGPESPQLNKLEDLAGKEVYVRRSSSYYESLNALSRKLVRKGLKPIRIRLAEEYFESEDIMEMVGAGLLPMTVVDRYRADFWAKILPGVKVRSDLVVADGTEIAWAVRKGCPKLMAVLNEFIKLNKGSKEMDRLTKRYFGNTKYILNPTASEDIRRFNDAVDFFRQYGEKYDMDYLLIAAQAYQESRINQAARSPMGAVGVMQVLPSTAKDPVVGIPDIYKIDKNIHAGVKYSRHLIDTYFNSPDISPLDKMLFSFAAYNAGPGNVIKMRKVTEGLGLNPNCWFSNVEIGAARVVGQETVRYVSNIYKYYVAYRLAREQMKARNTMLQSVKKSQ